MPVPWHLWRDGAHDAAWNMACDAALLEQASALQAPLFRFYAWSRAAATFGYAQSYAAVATLTSLRPLVRRPTGGGLVAHDADWTYSLVVPRIHSWYALSARDSYERVHRWLQAAFAALSAETALAPTPSSPDRARCFAGPERHDLVWRGHKIAGAAQRRTKAGLLIQGSVQPGALPVSRPDWENAVAQAALTWQVTWSPFTPSPELLSRTQTLADSVFGQDAHNRRR